MVLQLGLGEIAIAHFGPQSSKGHKGISTLYVYLFFLPFDAIS